MAPAPSGSADGAAPGLVVVIAGPSGAGKGTIAERLVADDDRLWLSRSWTTRPPRPGESHDAYVFVTRDAFVARRAEGGFLEHAEVFSGHLYGTPTPDPPPEVDVLLEIDVQGAEQVRQRVPGALVIFLKPPSRTEQERRLRDRGDAPEAIRERLTRADAEERRLAAVADATVVNDDLDAAVTRIGELIEERRRR